MDTVMTLNWLETRQISSTEARREEQARAARLTREHTRLAEENERLRQQRDDLIASAELWIRLYAAALARANGVPQGAAYN